MKYVVLMEANNFLFYLSRLYKKFKSAVDSVKDAPHACRPKTATSQKKWLKKVKDWLLLMQDVRL
jgi:hypothetical protein